jgi:hypothetical protein
VAKDDEKPIALLTFSPEMIERLRALNAFMERLRGQFPADASPTKIGKLLMDTASPSKIGKQIANASEAMKRLREEIPPRSRYDDVVSAKFRKVIDREERRKRAAYDAMIRMEKALASTPKPTAEVPPVVDDGATAVKRGFVPPKSGSRLRSSE